MAEKGVKPHLDKPRMDLIPPEVMTAMGTVLAHGVKVHAERGWESGTSWGVYFAASQRHLWGWWAGEKVDPESGHSPLWHAACDLAILIAYEARGIGTDDRQAGAADVNDLIRAAGGPGAILRGKPAFQHSDSHYYTTPPLEKGPVK